MSLLEGSKLRLFLSVDVAGSTNLKNIKNYNNLLNKYIETEKIITSVIEQLSKNNIYKNTDKIEDIINECFRISYSKDDLDWAKIIESTFNNFHSTFIKNVNKGEFFPWKALGDELIYSFVIENHDDLHEKVIAFLKTIREIDKILLEKNHIRLKGTAWTAGFPVRNREINFPFPKIEKYPYPRKDFLGPDMDIGFRLGKTTWPGILSVSMELAYLLGECESKSQVRLLNVGFEKLKGVWAEKAYPIFWAFLPENEDPSRYDYKEYFSGDIVESPYLKYLDKHNSGIKEAKEYLDTIKEVRDKLPQSLGVIKPYIPNQIEEEDLEKSHLKILRLIQFLSENEAGIGGLQDKDGDSPIDSDKDLVNKAQEKIKKKLSKNKKNL